MTSTTQRLGQLASAVTGSATSKVIAKNDDDVVIVSALRTAITKVMLLVHILVLPSKRHL